MILLSLPNLQNLVCIYYLVIFCVFFLSSLLLLCFLKNLPCFSNRFRADVNSLNSSLSLATIICIISFYHLSLKGIIAPSLTPLTALTFYFPLALVFNIIRRTNIMNCLFTIFWQTAWNISLFISFIIFLWLHIYISDIVLHFKII